MWINEVANRFESGSDVPPQIRESLMAMLEHDEENSNSNARVNQYCSGGVCNVPQNLQPIWNYGCWCNFEKTENNRGILSGAGEPLDVYDEICRDYQLCSRCAKRDA